MWQGLIMGNTLCWHKLVTSEGLHLFVKELYSLPLCRATSTLNRFLPDGLPADPGKQLLLPQVAEANEML